MIRIWQFKIVKILMKIMNQNNKMKQKILIIIKLLRANMSIVY